jgi:hypothetical protein
MTRKPVNKMAEVLAHSFASFSILANNSLTPAQTKMCTRAAGHCLWALGIPEYNGFKAVEPDPIGDVFDIKATQAISALPEERA